MLLDLAEMLTGFYSKTPFPRNSTRPPGPNHAILLAEHLKTTRPIELNIFMNHLWIST